MAEYVKINGAEFDINVSYTKAEFFERFKNKIKYPWDCESTWKELVKYLPKQDKPQKQEKSDKKE